MPLVLWMSCESRSRRPAGLYQSVGILYFFGPLYALTLRTYGFLGKSLPIPQFGTLSDPFPNRGSVVK